MLMENRVEDSDGAVNAKKPRSLDLQTLYDQNPGLPLDKKQTQVGSLKRKHGTIDDDTGLTKKKSKKELLPSSVVSAKKIKKSLDEVYKGGSNSSTSGDLNKVESQPSEKSDDRANGIDGISLNQANAIVQIPKRRRDVVRRKKADVSNGLKQEGSLRGKVSSGDVAVDLNGGSKGNTGQDGELNGKPDQNGNSEGSFTGGVGQKAKRKKGFNDCRENISSKPNLLQNSEKENANTHAHFGEPSSNKKAKRNRKKRKETRIEIDAAAKDAKPNQSTGIPDDSIEDDEENLEANAARMLSSRFDPSCTGFSSNSKYSNSPFVIPLHGNDASHGSNLQSDSDVASGDMDARVLRPRNQRKRKGVFRKRRHFYEVLAKDVDAYWMVQRKIKVYWPLDQFWYFGKVIGYDPQKMLHHIKYDDREEEWIDLRNERIKLLLFPSELPFNTGRRGSKTEGKHDVKGKSDATIQDDCPTSSHKDSEPIISWLARTSGRMKSSSFGIPKKQKTSDQVGNPHPSSSTLSKGNASEGLDIGSSENSADKLFRNPALPTNSSDREVGRTSLTESISKSPIVYFRRRFRRKEHGEGVASHHRLVHFPEEQLVCSRVSSPGPVDGLGRFPQEHLVCSAAFDSVDSLAVPPKRSHPTEIFDCSGHLVSAGLLRFDDDLVILNLNVPVLNTEMFSFKLNLLPFLVPSYSFGLENLWLFHASLMHQHGTLMTLWPRVHLEMLFVDNFVGLRFLLFEGCLVQAIAFVLFVLDVFYPSNQQRKHVDGQLPVTSIRFQFSFLEDVKKHLVFAFYNCHKLGTSRWVFLDHILQKDCLLAKQLPPSECTYDNIKALENGNDHLNVLSGSREPSSKLGLQSRTRQPMTGSPASVIHKRSWFDRDGKCARLPPFALSFSAAPTFFLSLHLKLLMGCSISCDSFKDRNSISWPENCGAEQVDCCPDNGKNGASAGCEDAEIIQKPSQRSQVPDDDCLNKGQEHEMTSEQHDSSAQPSFSKDNCSSLDGKSRYCLLNGITVEIPLFDPQERPSGSRLHNGKSSKLVLNATDSAISSPSFTASRSSWHPSKIGSSSLLGNLSHALPDGKPDFFCSGPRKPRTQVSYSLPVEGHDITTKFRTHQAKGFSSKRIRRASVKRESDASRNYERHMESLSCDVNVLVIMGDRGWREDGARVVLELVDDNEWRLAVKISGSTRYAYKPPQFLQPGSTNRYTHAMMWKGGKDWILEFPDRSQWALFKEMHEECYNRNFRAASVKNIPIPGVCLIEENDDNGVELPFVRSSPKYFRQLQTDVDIAMDPSRVLYDMDSNDELWISKMRSSDVENCNLGNVTDEMFEKIMDTLEKVAYAKQQDHFTSDELDELTVEGGPMEAIKIIYEYWLEKRQKKGMPLIRHLQPPLWERYQQQLKEWESTMSKNNGNASSGCREKATSVEKPAMYAFCLKPRGLELPNNRGTKHRSQKKLPVTGHGNVVSGDPEAFHSFGRRFNGSASGEERTMYRHGSFDSSPLSTRLLSPRDVGGRGYFSSINDGYERSHYPRFHRTKSRKIGTPLPANEPQVFPSQNQRFMSRKNGMQAWNRYLPEWPSSRYCQPEGPLRLRVEHLDPSDLDEFRLRDAASAAQHAVNMAKLKRENAQRLLYKADLAIHKAVVALMTAEAIKASSENSTNDASSEG